MSLIDEAGIRKRDAKSGTSIRGLAGPRQAPQRDRRALLAALDELRAAASDVVWQRSRSSTTLNLTSAIALDRLQALLEDAARRKSAGS